MYTGLAAVVVVFLYWGHCECLANLVGPAHVLSAVMFYEQIKKWWWWWYLPFLPRHGLVLIGPDVD